MRKKCTRKCVVAIAGDREVFSGRKVTDISRKSACNRFVIISQFAMDLEDMDMDKDNMVKVEALGLTQCPRHHGYELA